MASVEDGELNIAVEEVISWLPSHVLDEALYDYRTTSTRSKKECLPNPKHQHFRHRPKLHTEPPPSFNQVDNKPNTRGQHRPKSPINCVSGGHGMQAFFLESSRGSCTGTGVFLPQRSGSNNSHSKRKPACSRVLLPSRVVQALNLNVHALGLRDAKKNNSKNVEDYTSKVLMICQNKSCNEDVSTKSCAASRTTSPEICLPKEWTY